MPILIKYYKCIICLEEIIQIGRKMVDCRYFTLEKMKVFLKDKNLNMPLSPSLYTQGKTPHRFIQYDINLYKNQEIMCSEILRKRPSANSLTYIL